MNASSGTTTTAATRGGPGDPATARRRNRRFLLAGLFAAFVLAGFVSGFASSSPDGLEKVAEDEGFAAAADDHAFADFPIADYAVSGIGNERLAGALAGVIGVVVAFAVGGAVALVALRLRPSPVAEVNRATGGTAAGDGARRPDTDPRRINDGDH